MAGPPLTQATIADMLTALETGAVTAVGLVRAHLDLIERHDGRLNAVPVRNERALEEAAASDRRRAAGEPLGALDGIPYVVKDSFKVAGMTVAAGSPAFADLVARDDAFTVAWLRAAGAVLVGRTTMPPMAAGGMQRGVYGRAESPYNPAFLTAAFGSGSSNGSGSAVAAGFAAFGLAEETLSSGRSPASNNALVAYTPSRGLISMRGNWPLVPTCDVVVPHTRTVEDLLRVLEVLVAEDPVTCGDLWRDQTAVALPRVDAVRPPDWHALPAPGALAGTRVGVPRMYVGEDDGGREPIVVRPSILELWRCAAADLEALGAQVELVELPAVSSFEGGSLVERGLLPADWRRVARDLLVGAAWEEFLADNGAAGCSSLADVDGTRIFPRPPGALPDRYDEILGGDIPFAGFPQRARDGVLPAVRDVPGLAQALRGLEEARRVDLEDWMDAARLDLLAFPANADVGAADSDVYRPSADHAWRNGVRFSNGNYVIRHLGIPTVTVPMGITEDIGMPVGLTFAGRAYRDADLLRWAFDYEAATRHRRPPPLG
jgi:amidase